MCVFVCECVCVSFDTSRAYKRDLGALIHASVFESLVQMSVFDSVMWRSGGLGSSTISKNLMSPTPRRKWYLTTGRRAH